MAEHDVLYLRCAVAPSLELLQSAWDHNFQDSLTPRKITLEAWLDCECTAAKTGVPKYFQVHEKELL